MRCVVVVLKFNVVEVIERKIGGGDVGGLGVLVGIEGVVYGVVEDCFDVFVVGGFGDEVGGCDGVDGEVGCVYLKYV